jgi:HD-GYP domain-containing protein (c-di-GMP phosphodiesterase class II)
MGHPMEHVLRQSFIALRLAERVGLGAPERQVVHYSSMLAWVGCHVDAYEQAKWFGDDQAVKHDIRQIDLGKPLETAAFVLRHIGQGRPLLERARLGVNFLADGRRGMGVMFENHWRAAEALAARLGLGQRVRDSVEQTFERWDGKGEPHGVRGEEVLMSSRLVNLADVVAVYHQLGGVAAAVAVAKARSGTQFDPALVELFCGTAKELFDELDSATSWDAVMTAEPALDKELSDTEFDAALEAIGDFVDLKSPHTIGHSRSVADLASEAARVWGMPEPEMTTLRRAALVHDLGRLGVSNAIWDKETPLTRAEAERIRLHPYFTERMLAFSPALAGLAAVAVQHHERLDGSGYPRGLTADALTSAGRVLAVADRYRSKAETRPHRRAACPEEVRTDLRAEVRAGRLDGEAVDAVLRAAGHRVRHRRGWPAGLTPREVEVLRLLARGLSHKQIAEQLVISRKTASNHVEHIYAKIGVSNRALASVYAIQHGLMSSDGEQAG